MASIMTLADIQDLKHSLLQSPPLTRLKVGDIRPHQDVSDRFVQGRIKHIGGLVKHMKLPIQYRKLFIKENDTGEGMHVVLLVDYTNEDFATQLNFLRDDNLKLNDMLVMTNFRIENDPLFPLHDMSNTYQAVIDLSSSDSKIVLIRSNCSSSQVTGQLQNTSTASLLPSSRLTKPKIQRPYVYVKLRDLAPGTTVNIFGFVKFVKEATQTCGLDCSMMVSIVDETLNSTVNKLKCVLFGSLQTLPPVKCGQIIRFHRLKITTFKDGLQGQKGPAFSWVIYDGTVDGPLTPISTSSVNNTLTNDDEETVKRLRLWAASEDTTLSQESISQHKPSHPSLSDVRLDQYFDLICQVVGTCVLVDGESVLLKVWDGTLAKIELYQQVVANDLASRFHLNKSLAKRIQRYVVDVFVYDDHFITATKVKPGDFIKLQNLHTARHKPRSDEKVSEDCPAAELCLHKGFAFNRCLVILESTSAEVVKLKETLDRVLAENGDSTDLFEEVCVETPLASTSSKFAETRITASAQITSSPQHESISNATGEDSEEYFTANSHVPRNEASVVPAGSFDEDIHIEGTILDENEANIPNNKKTPLKDLSAFVDDVNPKRKKVEHSKIFSQNKENSAVVETRKVDSHCAERFVTTGSQCSMASSFGFATDRCMLTTATVLTGHHHIQVTRVDKILKHVPPCKFRFQGYAINYQPKSESVDGFLKLYCERCKFLSPVPSSSECPSLDSSQLSGTTRAPILKCVDNEITIYSCPDCSTDLKYIFMMEFILNDGSGWLCAGLWRQQADRFFGCSPVDVLQNPNMYSEIKEKLNIMCFGRKTCKNVERNSDLDKSDASKMECCLMSYRIPCGIGFQIFDTMFALTS